MSETSSRPKLTAREREVLDALRSYITDHSRPPTMRELTGLTGLSSTSSVIHQLRNLQDKGYIRAGQSRSARQIEIVDPDEIGPEELAQLRALRDFIRDSSGPVPVGEVLPTVIEELRRRISQPSAETDPLGGSTREETTRD